MPDRTHKPSLILVHAAGRGGRSWDRLRPLLDDVFDIVAPDLPGFGRAGGGTFSMSGATQLIADLARTLHPPVRLVGLSLGASVGIAVAAAHPKLIDRMVLSAPALRAADHPWPIRIYRHLPGWLVRRTTDLPSRAAWLALVEEIAAVDLMDALPAITAKTLVLCGSRDRANLPDAQLAGATIPHGEFYLVPHVGHAWPVTQPKLFATVVRPFLTVSLAESEGRGADLN